MNVPNLGAVVDERFLLHRLRSTSVAAMVGGAVAGGLFLYHYFARHELRWDLMVVLLAMAVVKTAVLIYYRITD